MKYIKKYNESFIDFDDIVEEEFSNEYKLVTDMKQLKFGCNIKITKNPRYWSSYLVNEYGHKGIPSNIVRRFSMNSYSTKDEEGGYGCPIHLEYPIEGKLLYYDYDNSYYAGIMLYNNYLYGLSLDEMINDDILYMSV